MSDMPSTLPRVTLAFLSWNRLHYLRATVESARRCIDYPNLEWLISDNESVEPGLSEYLESLVWFDGVFVQRQNHASAMNQLVEAATGDYILIWPEDVQFTVEGNWMTELVAVLEANKDIGSVCLDYMRSSTLKDIFKPSLMSNRRRFLDELVCQRGRIRRHRICMSPSGYKVFTMGWMRPGIVGSGIPSLTATSVWRELGPWRATGERKEVGLVDSSLGAEEDMLQRAQSAGLSLQRAAPLVPVAADIITDPSGCKAKVRGGYRYGVYMPPPEGEFYYQIKPMQEVIPENHDLPMDFTRGVQPMGFRIPMDRNGERKKSSINTSVVFDLDRDQHVTYPLSNPDVIIE